MTARVAVIGGGAVGTVIAAGAARAGHDVTVCVRQRSGTPLVLRRDGVDSTLEVAVLDDPAAPAAVDWVFLATKAYDVDSARRWLPALLGPGTAVVVCQNGIDHAARLAETAHIGQIVPAVVGIVAQRTAPGVVTHRQGQSLTVADDPAGAALVALFRGTTDLDVVLSPDIDRAVWLKFLGNLAAAPVTTLTMQPIGVLRSDGLRWLVDQLMTEAVGVAQAAGIRLNLSDVDETRSLLYGLDPAAQTSMQADRAAGRPLETETLTGELVRWADRYGVPVPGNRTLLTLLRHLSNREGH